MNPRTIAYAALLAVPLALVAPSIPAGALPRPAQASGMTGALPRPTAQASGTSGTTSNALFGGTVPLVSEQGALGRKLAIVRMYYYLGQQFTTRHTQQVMSAGSTVLASLDDPTRGPSYASIAAGHYDKQILTWLTQANQGAVTYHLSAVYVSFQHEANDPSKKALGTPAQFVAAWDHIHALAAKAHLNWNTGGRLRWALILEHYAYFAVNQRPGWSLRLGMASSYWAGTSNVDVVAADGYDRGGCRTSSNTTHPTQPSVSPGSLFDPVLTWAQAHGGPPVFLAEWAGAYYSGDPAFQANFITQMQAYVLANPRIAAAMYWDNHGNLACQFTANGHPASLTALAAMGRVVIGHA
jgi:hypothetical protein